MYTYRFHVGEGIVKSVYDIGGEFVCWSYLGLARLTFLTALFNSLMFLNIIRNSYSCSW